MIVLDAADKRLEIVLDAAKTTLDCHVVAAYWSIDASGQWTIAANEVKTNGTTPVSIVAGPTAGLETARVIENVYIYNDDTATKGAILQVNHGATIYIVRQWDALAQNATAVLKRDGSAAEEAV